MSLGTEHPESAVDERQTEGEVGYDVQPVMPSVAPQIWSLIEALIERARNAVPDCVSKRETSEDVLHKVEEGAYQLWLITHGHEIVAATVTAVEQMGRQRVLVVHYQAGTALDKWIDVFVEETEGWAEENGCDQAQICGRDGWGPKMKPHGFRRAFVTYVRDL